jgi:serine protease Do
LSLASAQEGGGEPRPTPPQPTKKAFDLPDVLKKNAAPASVEELRQIETHVQKVVEKVMPAVVGLRIGKGQGSGVIVDEIGTILTAGHVSGKPEEPAAVLLFNSSGKTVKAKTFGQNKSIDSGMVKLDEGKYAFVEMGKSSDLKVGQWVIAIGHPGGFRPNRTPVVRVGRILVVNQFVIRTDCTLVGGDSGGPLFDMQGRVIGIHSRIGGFAITENMHVPVDTYRETWDKLAKGDSWGTQIGQAPTVRSAGGRVVFEKDDALTKTDPAGACPAHPDDKTKKSFRKVYTVKMQAGSTYTVDLISSDKKGTAFDTFLKIENPDGKELAHDDDGGGFPHSRIVHRPIATGDVHLVATSFEANQTGKFRLVVREADFQGGAVEVLKAVKIPPPVVPKFVKDLGKAKVQLEISALVIDAKGAPLPGKEIAFAWDNGKESVKTDSEGFARWPLKADRTAKLRLELPDGLRAALVLTDVNGTDLSLNAKDMSKETVKSAGGKVVKTFEGKIAKTDPFDAERDKCHRHVHEFKMQAGKTYTLDLASEDFDAYLRVEQEEKGKLAEDDDGAGFLNSRIVFTPSGEGMFRLVVTTCDPGQFGAYRLTIRETDAKPVEEKKELKKESKK